MALQQKAFSDIITFSRSSNATRTGPDGTVQYAPHNLLLRSQELDNAAWTKDNCTATANAIAAPDGTVTADMITDGASGSPSLYLAAFVTITASAPYTASGYVKRGNTDWIRFIIQDGAFGNQTVVWFNLATGATSSGVTLTSVGNGWYRFSVTATIGSASTAQYQINTAASNGSNTRVSGGTYYLWGAQLSVGSIAGDYTPTTSAAVYGPRFDYDPVTKAAKGLLIEEQRTNLLTYSEQFDNAVWSKVRMSITSNSTSAPDGTTTADTFVEDTTASNTHVLYVTQSGLTSGVTYSFSLYVKANGRTQVNISCGSTAFTGIGGTLFDLSANTASNGTGVVGSSITDVGNGWKRIVYTVTANGTGSGDIYIGTYVNGSGSYTGNGTSGVYVWGAQLEAGAFATSYIPTIASSVTRSADVATVNTLSPWYNATEGTLYAEFAGAAGWAVQLGEGANFNNRIAIGSTGANFLVSDATGTNQVNIGSYNGTATAFVKIAGAYKVNDFACSINGGAVTVDTIGTVPAPTSMMIGARNTASPNSFLNSWVKRIAYYPRRMTNAELQALTA